MDKQGRLQSAYSSLTRPTSAAIMKMLNKVAPQPGKNPKKVTAQDLQKLISRANKTQKKASRAQNELVAAFSAWAAEFPSEETTVLMRQFSEVIGSVGLAFSTQADRFANLKTHLGAIATRETRQQFLADRHETLMKQQKEAHDKHGPHAHQTMLCVDRVEENEYNLKLIEQQLARSAATNLREAFVDYLIWLQGAVVSVSQASNRLAGVIREDDARSPVRVLDVDERARDERLSAYFGRLSPEDSEDRVREERSQERIREERAREDRMREEMAREGILREERVREEKFREEMAREERLREERLREERLREERREVFPKVRSSNENFGKDPPKDPRKESRWSLGLGAIKRRDSFNIADFQENSEGW